MVIFQSAINSIKNHYHTYPLKFILIVALIPRVIAAIFAKGYGMHDDAFGPVQTMQELLENFDIIYIKEPSLLLYPMFQYIIFGICEFFDIIDPQFKMYVVRFGHAFYSLLVVIFSYKITLLISNEKNAKSVGMMIALL